MDSVVWIFNSINHGIYWLAASSKIEHLAEKADRE
jgi:hypothetical protein